MPTDEAVPEEGAGISGLYLEGVHLDEEQGRLVQSLPSVKFCSVPLDEAVPEEGAGISGIYLEGARWDEEQGKLVESRPKIRFSPLPTLLHQPRYPNSPILYNPLCVRKFTLAEKKLFTKAVATRSFQVEAVSFHEIFLDIL